MIDVKDEFLTACCQKGASVTVFTTNGFQIKGEILSFDKYVIVLRREDRRQAMVYQSAISTILPG